MLPGKGRFAFIALPALIFFICLLSSPAQAKDDWPAPSQEELALKDNPASPGAHAMILYRESTSDDRLGVRTDYIRIKIFTDEGKKYADIEIPFYHGIESVNEIHARTIHPDGKVVEWDGKVFEKLLVKAGGFKFQVKTFTLPEVQPRSIIEYKYRIQHDSRFISNTTWDVQEDLFTRRALFTVRPNTILGALYWRAYRLPEGTEPQKQKDGSMRLEVQNVAGLEKEQNMPPPSELRGRLEFFYRDNPSETMEEFWKRVTKEGAKNTDNFIGNRSAIRQAAVQVVAANDVPEVKLQKLYARAQQVRNLALDQGKTEKEEKREKLKDNDNVEDVIKHGYGSSPDINRFFVALARAAGFEADWVRVVPRYQNFFHPELQDVRQLTADVAVVRLASKNVYLDPACNFCPYGFLPWYETGVGGVRLNKQGSELINTPAPKSAEAIMERKVDVRLKADGDLEGKWVVNFLGQYALEHRQDERTQDDTGRRKDLTEKIKKWLPANARLEIKNVTGWEGSTEPLHIEGTLTLPEFAASTGRRLLLPLTVFDDGHSVYFQTAQRKHPVYLLYPYQTVDEVSLELPEGFRVESLPKADSTPATSAAMYQVSCKQEGNQLRIVRRAGLEGIYFPLEYYGALRTFFHNMKAKDEEKIVLQSIQAAQRP
ncbi:MAG: DUF3857 domain-containing protein [Acidobacteriia bacterium]|nr:DUF3857 domain-containing protein [Terriglobia bacterium]